MYVAYVGATSNAWHRLNEHLVRRNSSVTTGDSPVLLRPEFLVQANWWCDPEFGTKVNLLAAELVAFDILDPILRSRDSPGKDARALASSAQFRRRVQRVLEGSPSGVLRLDAWTDLLKVVNALNKRLDKLEGWPRTKVD